MLDKIIKFLESNPLMPILISLVSLFTIATLHKITGFNSYIIFYLIPIMILAWFNGFKYSLTLSVAIFIFNIYGKTDMSIISDNIIMLFAFIAIGELFAIFSKIESNKRALQEKLSQQKEIIDNNIPIARFDFNGQIIEKNIAFEKNYTANSLDDLLNNMEDKLTLDEIMEVVKNGLSWTGEVQCVNRDGQVCWSYDIITPEKNPNGEINKLNIIKHDITEKKEIEKLSITDGLTGLYNRRHLDVMLKTAIHTHNRFNKEFSVLLFDVDHFKLYNDSMGHSAGDDVLRKIGQRLREIITRATDTCFRYGGEEFCILLTDANSEGAIIVAEKVRKGIEDLQIVHKSSKTSPFVTISIGIATFPPRHNMEESNIIENADKALYKAKEAGRNQFKIYD